MSKQLSRRSAIAFLIALGLVSSSQARDLAVDIELVLAVDVSASMDFDELRLQRQGYVAAFRSPELIEQIRSLPLGRIAVAYFEWGDQDTQDIIVPWTLVNGPAGAEEVAAELEAAPLGHAFGTSIAGALTFANAMFQNNGFAGQRRTIDISGDGPNTAGTPVVPARDSVLAHGVTINGLPIMIRLGWSSGLYRTCGIGFLLRGLRDRRARRLHCYREEPRAVCRGNQTQADLGDALCETTAEDHTCRRCQANCAD